MEVVLTAQTPECLLAARRWDNTEHKKGTSMFHFVTAGDREVAGLGGVSTLFSEVDRWLRERDALVAEQSSAWPRIHAKNEADAYELKVELPGVPQEEIQLDVHRGVLTISGERKLRVPEGFRTLRRERGALRFSRSVQLPEDVKSEAVQASMRDGLLSIRLPKSPNAEPKKIQITAQ
jgi:HSP20 family molecular chaperone IbpA